MTMKLLTAFLLLLFVALGEMVGTESSASEASLTSATAGTAVPATAGKTTKVTTATPVTAGNMTTKVTTATAGTAAPAQTGNVTTATAPTAAPATNQTTAPPTTTAPPETTAPPHTTIAPATLPPPPSVPWQVNGSTGMPCILAEFSAKFSGMYTMKNKSKGTFDFLLPENSVVDTAKSRCGSDMKTALMVLKWADDEYSMTLEFELDYPDKTYQLKSAKASLTHKQAHFPDSNTTEAVEYGGAVNRKVFKAKYGMSFKCASTEQISFAADDFKFTFGHLKVQPFDVNGDFSPESPCEADTGPAHWALKDAKGQYCLLANFNVVFMGDYMKNDNKTAQFNFSLPADAQVDEANSHCGDSNGPSSAVLTLTFNNGSSFTQMFAVDSKTNKTFYLANATAQLVHDKEHFPDSKDAGKTLPYGGALSPVQFTTDLGMYFKCSAEEKVSFTKDKFSLSYTDLKLQPFDVDKTYGNLSQCGQDTPTRGPPVPPMGNWTIYGSDKKKCMLMLFSAQFIISYTTADSKMGKVGYYLPENLDTSASTCSNTTATFSGRFSPGDLRQTPDWVISMKFVMDKDKNYALRNFTLEYMMDDLYFPDLKQTKSQSMMVFNDGQRFDSTAGNYYMCEADQEITAGNLTATFMNMKVQPFAEQVKGGGLGDPSDCAADNSVSNIVPIAVGCALAGLVIIVLIAYLIGRSRANRSGYQSV